MASGTEMFGIESKDLEKFERYLTRFNKLGVPFATKQALNDTAFDARKEMQRQISTKLIERNKWTKQSIRVEKTKTLDIDKQESAFGSIEKYMVGQEYGRTEHKKGKHGVAIPTGYAAGQRGQRPITRLPLKRRKMRNLQLRRLRITGATKHQRLTVTVTVALKNKQRFVFLKESMHGVKTGIYNIVGGRARKKETGWPKGARLHMVHDLSEQSVTVRPTKTLLPAFDYGVKRLAKNYRQALLFQLKRAGLT